MSKLLQQSDKNADSEGGMFYPTGYLVTAFDASGDASRARDALAMAGFDAEELTLVSAEEMQRQAAQNLEHPTLLAALGSTVAIRQKQFDLAEEGCTFLLVPAASDEEEAAAVAALDAVPVRYAVKYRRLVIENLLPKLAHATPDPEPARASGSSR